jgi:hypothetical protein
VQMQIRGDLEDLDRDPFYLKGDALVLGKSLRYSNDASDGLQVRIMLPELRELRVGGSGDVYVKSFVLTDSGRGESPLISVEGSGDLKLFAIEGPSVEFRAKGSGLLRAMEVNIEDIKAVVAGSGDLFVKTLQARSGEFVITGSGDITVTESGFVEDLEVSVVGSGDARLESIDCDFAEVNIVGSGDAVIGEVKTQLNASVLGSGDIRYRGDPEVESVQLGSGEVRRRD